MEEKKQGPMSRLFGRKHSACCDVKIEEVGEEASEEGRDEGCGGARAAAAKVSPTAGEGEQQKPCCGGARRPTPSSRCCG